MIYLWLSRFFLERPTLNALKEQLDLTLLKSIRTVLGQNEEKGFSLLLKLANMLDDEKIRCLKEEYDNLFLIPVRGPHVPPYESAFSEKQSDFGDLWGIATDQVKQIYEAAGFEVELSGPIFAPDHIGLELAFMSALCQKETNAIEEKNQVSFLQSRALQRLFLQEHLASWLPALAQAVEPRSPTRFFASVSSIAQKFVNEDQRYIDQDAK